ncbi:SDR family oxidoreductase [Spirosoma areae]
MADAERILLTGASGNVGAETLRALMMLPIHEQVEVIAGLRDPNGALHKLPVQPTGIVAFDFTDATTFDAALSGVSRVLLVRPPQIADVDKFIKPFVDAMKRAGVRQVVFLSLQGVEDSRNIGPSLTPHHKIEKLLVESGLPFTFLRPSFFMQNLSTTHQDEIRFRSEIFIPAGQGRTSFVDVRDIAAVATLALTSQTNAYVNRGFELTGSDALTYTEIAEILTEVLGRKITYRNPSIGRFIWQKWQKERLPLGFTMIMVALYTVSKLGKADKITRETERLLNRPPLTFRQFAMDYRGIWIP